MAHRGLGLARGGLALLPAFILGIKPCSAFHRFGGSTARPSIFLSQPMHTRTCRYPNSNGYSPSRSLFQSSHSSFTTDQRGRHAHSFFQKKNAVLAGGAAAGFGSWLIWQGSARLAHSEAAQPADFEASQHGSADKPEHSVGHTNVLPGGLVTIEHTFRVPRDYSNPSAGTMEIFCRELVAKKHKDNTNLPYMLFLQGGPGFPAGRPMSADSGWIKRALQEYRVLLLDQRGTGRSTPVTHESLGRVGTADEQAAVLGSMRADNIIRDCETIRGMLLGKRKWTVLGQSFGGFCIMTYLSLAPQGLDKAILTGGLPPVYSGCSADDVYRHTYARMTARNDRFYDRYPQHVQTVRDIVAHLEKSPVQLPGGGVLTARRFLQLGLCLGSGAGFEHLHYLLERPWTANGQLSYEFLRRTEDETSFDTNPMYAAMHEAIYCSGKGQASLWSAQRMMPAHFDHNKALQTDSKKIYLFAEHCFPWMFEGDYYALRGLKEAAEIIARKNDWPALYDETALQNCKVPTAALIYYDDVYVERQLSEATAQLTGSRGTPMKVWVTNEYQHSGIRDDGYRILDRLLGMLDGTVNIPS